MNRFELSARIVERDSIRYTPAGIAMVDCVLEHQSSQQEFGQSRNVVLEIAALGVGPLAVALAGSALGSSGRFVGFLARKSQKNRYAVYHITQFELF